LKRLKELGIDINMIAPDHGLIWRSHVKDILKAYKDWANYKSKKKALIIYDTMWRSTEMMAKAVTKGILKEGISSRLMNLKVTHRSDIIAEVLDSRALIFGSPTLNNGVLPRMADLLSYMKGLKPRNKISGAFGSYGWSGEAVKIMNDSMEEMKFDITEPGIRVKYVPTHDHLKECLEMGRRIGRAVNAIIG
jgi:flavorubredoxin